MLELNKHADGLQGIKLSFEHTALTFSMLAFIMLKCPLKCASALTAGAHKWISQQPKVIEQCFNILNTFLLANKSL